jgi:hypothetical protein
MLDLPLKRLKMIYTLTEFGTVVLKNISCSIDHASVRGYSVVTVPSVVVVCTTFDDKAPD